MYHPWRVGLRGLKTPEVFQRFRRGFTTRFEQKLISLPDTQNEGDVTSDEIGENYLTSRKTCVSFITPHRLEKDGVPSTSPCDRELVLRPRGPGGRDRTIAGTALV